MSVLDLKDEHAELAWTNNFPGIVNVTFDADGLCYLDQGNYGTNPLFQSEVKRIAPGSQLKRQKSHVLIDDIKPSDSTSIPLWFDPNNLYVTNDLTTNRYPPPISEKSQKLEWFRLDAPGLYCASTLLLSKSRILMTILKPAKDEGTKKKPNSYAILLFDLDLQGFYILDRVIDTCTMTTDGKVMLFADDEGYLKRFEMQFD